MRRFSPFGSDSLPQRHPLKCPRDEKHHVLITSGEPAQLLYDELVDNGVWIDKVLYLGGDIENQQTEAIPDQKVLQRRMQDMRYGRDSKMGYFITAFLDEVLNEDLIVTFPNEIIGLHASLLPEYPGPDPVSSQLEAGLQWGGLTAYKVTEQLDGGPIYMQRRFEMKNRTPLEVYRSEVVKHGAALLTDVIKSMDSIIPTEQSMVGWKNFTYK